MVPNGEDDGGVCVCAAEEAAAAKGSGFEFGGKVGCQWRWRKCNRQYEGKQNPTLYSKLETFM